MSTAVDIAIVNLMLADTALVEALAPNPADASKPAIFPTGGNTGNPVYPSLEYFQDNGTSDGRFRPAFLDLAGSATQTPKVEDVLFYTFEAWANTPDGGAVIDTVLKRIAALFHDKRFSTTDGPVFDSRLINQQPWRWDKNFKAWYGFSRYRMRISTPLPV